MIKKLQEIVVGLQIKPLFKGAKRREFLLYALTHVEHVILVSIQQIVLSLLGMIEKSQEIVLGLPIKQPSRGAKLME